MTGLEFNLVLNRLQLIARFALETDVESFVEQIENAAAIAPFLNPDAHALGGNERLELIKKFALEVQRLKRGAADYAKAAAAINEIRRELPPAGGNTTGGAA